MKDIAPAEMIEWFKAKAAEFNRIAKDLESTFNSNGQPTIQPVHHEVIQEIQVDMVKNALNELGRPSRYSSIAEHLKADRNKVWDVLNSNPSDFEQYGRGWWKIKE